MLRCCCVVRCAKRCRHAAIYSVGWSSGRSLPEGFLRGGRSGLTSTAGDRHLVQYLLYDLHAYVVESVVLEPGHIFQLQVFCDLEARVQLFDFLVAQSNVRHTYLHVAVPAINATNTLVCFSYGAFVASSGTRDWG